MHRAQSPLLGLKAFVILGVFIIIFHIYFWHGAAFFVWCSTATWDAFGGTRPPEFLGVSFPFFLCFCCLNANGKFTSIIGWLILWSLAARIPESPDCLDPLLIRLKAYYCGQLINRHLASAIDCSAFRFFGFLHFYFLFLSLLTWAPLGNCTALLSLRPHISRGRGIFAIVVA